MDIPIGFRGDICVEYSCSYSCSYEILNGPGKLCIKKVLLSNCLAELMELHQVFIFLTHRPCQ
jgi:hypothetical protein